MQLPLYHRQPHGRESVHGKLVVPGAHPAVLLQPPDAPLHRVPQPVQARVEHRRAAPLAAVWLLLLRDGRPAPAAAEPPANPRHVVRPVPGHSGRSGSPADPKPAQHPRGEPRLVRLPGRQLGVQGEAVPARREVELRSGPAPAAAERAVRRFPGRGGRVPRPGRARRRPDAGTVDAEERPIGEPLRVDPVSDAGAPPHVEVVVRGLPRAELLRQPAPPAALRQHVQGGLEHLPAVCGRWTAA
jgi:hypothetical protein